VIIDIGGGTADVAMYGSGATLALDSVMLGGEI
jgi:cell division ATPase FtsA